MDFNYLLPNGRSLTTGKLRGKWTTSVSVRSSISYITKPNVANVMVKINIQAKLTYNIRYVDDSDKEFRSTLTVK